MPVASLSMASSSIEASANVSRPARFRRSQRIDEVIACRALRTSCVFRAPGNCVIHRTRQSYRKEYIHERIEKWAHARWQRLGKRSASKPKRLLGIICLVTPLIIGIDDAAAVESATSSAQENSIALAEIVDVGIETFSICGLSHGAETYLRDFCLWFK